LNQNTAYNRFKKDYWGIISLCYIIFIFFIALLAYIISPDKSINANKMHLSIHSKPMGFSTEVLIIPSNIKKKRSFIFGNYDLDKEIPFKNIKFKDSTILLTLYGRDKNYLQEISLDEFPVGVGEKKIREDFIKKKKFLLGTDKYGRDLLSRLIIGTRVSLSVGFISVIISLIIGIFLGALAGYFGGWLDNVIVWLINVSWSIPTLLLVIGITIVLGKGFWQVFIAIGLTMWVEIARLVRGQVKLIKEYTYIEAVKSLGFSDSRIIFRHILPLLLGPIIVVSTANFASAILIESGLSFLGIGVQPPVPSWGSIIKNHYHYLLLGKYHLAIIPGIFIMSLVLTFIMLGNSLRDAFDVKS